MRHASRHRGRGRQAVAAAMTLAVIAASCGGGDDDDDDDEPAAAEEEPAEPPAEEPATCDGHEARANGGGQHLVERCDTLLKIAAAECGDRGAYLSIFEANRGDRMVGGKTFTDPNHIEVDWVLDIECDFADAYEIADEPPPTTEPQGTGGADEPIELELVVGVGIVSSQVSFAAELLRPAPAPIVSTGPIPAPAAPTSSLSLSDVERGSSTSPTEFGRRSTCDGPELGRNALAMTSIGYGEVENGVRTIELAANGVFVLKFPIDDPRPQSVTIADEDDRTVDVPVLPGASFSAHVFQLFLADGDQPGRPPRLPLGTYRYQVDFGDTVAEGILDVIAPEERVDFEHVSDSERRITVWRTTAGTSATLAAYEWTEEDCEAAWIGIGTVDVAVDGHWQRLVVRRWGADRYCLREDGADGDRCSLSVPTS